MELLLLIFLISGGILLLVLELYLAPSSHIAGVAGLVFFALASLVAFLTYGLLEGVGVLTLATFVSLLMVYFSIKAGIWDRLTLFVRLRPGSAEPNRDIPTRFLGKTGTAITPLRPTGIAEFDGERVEVTTEGTYIAAGSPLRVVGVDRRHIFVRLLENPPSYES